MHVIFYASMNKLIWFAFLVGFGAKLLASDLHAKSGIDRWFLQCLQVSIKYIKQDGLRCKRMRVINFDDFEFDTFYTARLCFAVTTCT